MTTLTQLIEYYCPDGVEYARLGDVASNLDRLRKPVTAKDRIPGPYPYYGANGIQDWVDDYLFEGDFVLLGEDGSVIHEDGTPFVHWAAGKIWVNNHAHILTVLDAQLSLRFLFHALKNTDVSNFVTGGTQLKINQKNLNRIPIPLPPREVQDAIVERLDAFAALIESLDSEIALREKRFEYFREQLLTFNESDDVEYVKLGDVADSVKSGATPKARTAEYYENGSIPWLRTNEVKFNIITSTEMMVTEKALAETPIKWIEAPSVVVAISGATAGRSAIIATPVTTNQHCCCLHFDEAKANYRFVFNSLALRYEELKSLGRGARGDLNAEIIKNFQIPLPSLEAQQDIVDKLDIMQALIDNLKQERELRRTQFEYYREKLLTFNS